MRRDRILGGLAIAASLAFALVLQARAPVGVPLYDGVIVVEPYRYLHPSGDQTGDPSSFESTPAVSGGVSPVFAAATEESPPQAQMIAMQGAFQLPAGTIALHVTITAVDPVAQPTGGSIAGNVYRFTVTNQAGARVLPTTCDACRSVVLRAPDGVTEGSVAVFANGAWTAISTVHAGTVGMYQANPGLIGDYAIIVGGAQPSAPPAAGGGGGLTVDPLVFGGIALALFFAAVAVLFWYRRRPPPVPVARLGGRRSGAIPSKRRPPRRPPSGRSGS